MVNFEGWTKPGVIGQELHKELEVMVFMPQR